MAPEFIPEPKDAKYRTVIILLDGTGDRDDKDATNIVKLWKMLYNSKEYPGNNDVQLVSYWVNQTVKPWNAGSPPPNQEGIGADIAKDFTGLAQYGWNKAKNTVDKAVATSFPNHIIQVYTWLAKNYQDNDKICIFGFSRGAYSARALAGMLNAMGLLRVSDPVVAKAAYELYEKSNSLPANSTPDWLALLSEWEIFRTENNVKKPFIEFLGCWDSVNSVGMVDNIKLAYTANNSIVHTFRHAVALDERRAKFKQYMWGPKKPAVAANAQPHGDNGPSVATHVEEVWFAGCHCDVGGGSVLNGTRPNLANIPLRWMIRECFKAGTGMVFSATELTELGIEPSHLYPDVHPRLDVDAVTRGSQTIRAIEAPGWVPWAKSALTSMPKTPQEPTVPPMSEEERDACDALAPLYDQLVLKSWMWQAMESFLTNESVYDAATNTFKNVCHQHRSAGRAIPPAESTYGSKIKVHRTVQMRMQATYENGPDKGNQYIPKARLGWKKEVAFDQIRPDLIEWVS
ncbi:hypothetical protein MVEN_01997300 [Mycena venus]|uniref:T6SS Phospholipase effector Tle1-like catalytic domain-containing protein n=1 Tax=Mycena venus TaxID=2733690 RepID=A0A8H6XEY1_9AGAR|nr:hypothetical protein MVEN_01997300 [Mycena venus]